MSSRSLAVRAGMGRTTSGTLTPLRSLSGPPTATSVSRWSARTRVTREAELAVVEQEVGADAGGGDDLGVGELDAADVAGHGVEVEAEGLAGLELDAAGLEAADAELGALDVGEDADGAVILVLELAADHAEALGVVLVGAVAEVEAEDVGAGEERRWRTSGLELAGPRVAMILVPAGGGGRGLAGSWLGSREVGRGHVIRTARMSLTLVRVGPVMTQVADGGEEP
jgi:hypothetical protein